MKKALAIFGLIIFLADYSNSANLSISVLNLKANKMDQIKADLEQECNCTLDGPDSKTAIENHLSAKAKELIDTVSKGRIYKTRKPEVETQVESEAQAAVADNYQ